MLGSDNVGRARAAFVFAVLGTGVLVAGFAYIGFVFATRPLHSGMTADFAAAIVLNLAGTAIALIGTLLRQRWRGDYVGREATVSWVTRNRYARVLVDGVPYWAFVRDEIHRGDRVLLKALRSMACPSAPISLRRGRTRGRRSRCQNEPSAALTPAGVF